jgi:hypothetical protein
LVFSIKSHLPVLPKRKRIISVDEGLDKPNKDSNPDDQRHEGMKYTLGSLLKVRNDEWVGARPSVCSTVLLWMRDIARPKGIVTEKRWLYKRGESWNGLWSGGSSSTLEGRGSSGV